LFGTEITASVTISAIQNEEFQEQRHKAFYGKSRLPARKGEALGLIFFSEEEKKKGQRNTKQADEFKEVGKARKAALVACGERADVLLVFPWSETYGYSCSQMYRGD
jgi:hypothetical protein